MFEAVYAKVDIELRLLSNCIQGRESDFNLSLSDLLIKMRLDASLAAKHAADILPMGLNLSEKVQEPSVSRERFHPSEPKLIWGNPE